MPNSQNGYPANDVNQTDNLTIPGTDRKIRLRKGPAGALLRLFASRFHFRIEDILEGVYDDWGYAARTIAGSTVLSNHASGTAVDINATQHPQYTKPSATFTPGQLAGIRALLNEFENVIRWGGDYAAGNLDPMHFEIIVRDEYRLARLLEKLLADPTLPPPATNPPVTSEENEPMLFDAGTNLTRTIPTNGKSVVDVFVSMGDKVVIHEWFGVGATPPEAAPAINRTWRFTDQEIDSDRSGPISIPRPDETRGITMRYSCPRAFTVAVR
jgi:hypothetical protein